MLMKWPLAAIACLFVLSMNAQEQWAKQEMFRPKIHFSPAEKWINDPNGLVYHKGVYHMFYQYYPDSTVWGPMHWGHATSVDLMKWQQQPVALYPDSLGYIFSGSVVVDTENTSGLGKNGSVPLVAIFTHHNPELEKKKSQLYQYQSIAYSNDDGKTWTKYAGNPVLPNPGITDFRDPKVYWFQPGKKWIMTLATKDRITFYSSADLKNWKKESEFGEKLGAHGGVWECPDLFPLSYEGRQVWVLLVSINPGGPNGGSATQYFLGDFDGSQFMPADTVTRWMDYGTDNYAGVTFFNTGDRKLLIGWMNNWQYAQVVPTKKWRGAMTLPRELKIKKAGDSLYLASELPAEVIGKLDKVVLSKTNIDSLKLTADKFKFLIEGVYRVSVKSPANDFQINLENSAGESLIIGYKKSSNSFYIDRSAIGERDFEPGFAKPIVAPRISTGDQIGLELVVDAASVELFADGGLTTMTAVYFSKKGISGMKMKSTGSLHNLAVYSVKR